MYCRGIYQKAGYVTLKPLPVCTANKLPRIADQDLGCDAFLGRMQLIKLESRFGDIEPRILGGSKICVPESEQEQRRQRHFPATQQTILESRLKAAAPAFLHILLTHYLELFESTPPGELPAIPVPEKASQWKTAWRAERDPIAHFIGERVDATLWPTTVTKERLWTEFQSWANERRPGWREYGRADKEALAKRVASSSVWKSRQTGFCRSASPLIPSGC